MLNKTPTIDPAEDNAYFPSPYSLSLYTAAKTDFDGLSFQQPYQGEKWKVLMIAADERYLLMGNGTFFSTGNHPVETLLPMHHIDQAGFEVEVATLSGNPVKLEMWAMPNEDEAVRCTYEKYLPKFRQPLKLGNILENLLSRDSPYLAVFIPGGHGSLCGIPQSSEVKQVLHWAISNDKLVITLCHGPCCLLAAGVGEVPEEFIFKGYKICVFPDSLDRGVNLEIGYMPGPMPWFVGEQLQRLGVEILNSNITGMCHLDRKLLTGDSPLASNRLGKMAAEQLLKYAAT
ncbi:glyoxalase III HchA [Planctomicrobium sp. SH668]|uniref:glyoxalase III HchA n=1 Tax=Planctomicrobium sp. SH668 TaxID=3448126 RepID=UPI003F5B20B3